MAAFQEILDVLPGRLQTLDFSDVQELRLRVGQAPAVLENGRERRLSGLVRPGELDGILQRTTSYSAHACQDALRQGYVTLPGGHRIGVCGSVVTRNGEMTGFRTVSSLCIRFARDIRLDEERLLPSLTESCLILGAPGAGKTTLLRACIRALSNSGERMCVCDDRGEISAMTDEGAQFDLGPQTDVLTDVSKSEGMTLLLRAMACGLILTALLNLAGFSAQCAALEENIVRLHVIANSNDKADQAVKLRVRDAVLREAEQWYGDAEDFDTAVTALCTHLESLEAAANSVLKAEDLPYCAKAEICEMYFPTRTYESFKLPAGRYRTLRISLGKAEGKNWWCVVFPALCMPGASDLSNLPDDTDTLVREPESYEVKFKVAEIFSRLRELFDA